MLKQKFLLGEMTLFLIFLKKIEKNLEKKPFDFDLGSVGEKKIS